MDRMTRTNFVTVGVGLSSSRLVDAIVKCGEQGRVVTMVDGTDTSRLGPSSAVQKRDVKRRFDLPTDGVLAVYVGVPTAYQGIDLLLNHAFGALTDVDSLRLAVAGFPEETYRERANSPGLRGRISFLDKVPFQETPLLTAVADIAVTPMISASEGNLKTYNYLDCGLPTIAFDTLVNREISGDLGVHVPVGYGTAPLEAIRELATDPGRCERLTISGRQRTVADVCWGVPPGSSWMCLRRSGRR